MSEAVALANLAAELRESAWELALEVVEAGLADETVPSLQRLGELGQVGELAGLIDELAQHAGERVPVLRVGSPLASAVRNHARSREGLGFAPREVVAELLLLRRVVARFASERGAAGGAHALDRLVGGCVLAYFDRAIAELAERARRDPLTGLLNHQAFGGELEGELERGRRYGHGLALVSLDLDRFKEVNDTLGHPAGDGVLRTVAGLVRETVRGSDLAGRMGGDEFAVCLVEADAEAAGRFLARLHDRVDEVRAAGELPEGFALSPGVAHFPSEAGDADTLFRLADARLYEAKRRRAA